MDAKMEQLILVTGPTGSGKSTTLAAMIEHVNQNSDRHIITIEDPIEYKYQCKKSLIHQKWVKMWEALRMRCEVLCVKIRM